MICVDQPMVAFDGRRWCHLFDSHHDVSVLHAFAARIGLKRCWFQRSRLGFPHYDLRASKIAAAIAAGAKHVHYHTVVLALKRFKEAEHGDIE